VSYKGEATFQEKDEAAQRVVIKANGKETRGSGNAAALVTAQLKDEGDGTSVVITTDLTISGKAAQFGRGVLADVAGNLIAQFAKRLEADVLGGSTGPAPTAGTDAPAARLAATEQADADDSVDLLKVVALPMAKRFAPVVAGVVAGAAVGFLLGRSRRRAQAHPAAEDLLAALSRLLS
jgi:hypothetical protein